MKDLRKWIFPVFLLYFEDPAPVYDGGSGAAGVLLNTNTTTQETLAPEMKTFYDKVLIDLMEPNLVHEQFGQKRPIPQNGGKTIEFRRYDALPELLTPLVEGVTPEGQSLRVTAMTATVEQYGGFVALSDMLEMTAIDNNISEATKALASQAGRTLDTLVRDVLAAGTNVRYAGGVTSRAALAAGDACHITVDDVRKAARDLEEQDAPRIDGYYVGIIHPRVKYDLMSDEKWRYPHEYRDTGKLYRGEIGELYGVRFVETTRAKRWEGAGASGADVFGTLILGENAYGITRIDGLGLEHIVKQRGSGGTGDPLNQRSTVAWKAAIVAKILIQQYMVRIESTASA